MILNLLAVILLPRFDEKASNGSRPGYLEKRDDGSSSFYASIGDGIKILKVLSQRCGTGSDSGKASEDAFHEIIRQETIRLVLI